jgi:hypothetical protein
MINPVLSVEQPLDFVLDMYCSCGGIDPSNG